MNFIFADLETTGLEPAAHRAAILEIALVAVDNTLTELSHWHSPITQPSGFVGDLDPKIIEMHSNNGLLGEIRGERAMLRFEAGGLPTLKQAEQVACQFVDAYGVDATGAPNPYAVGRRATIAGFNPAFDLSWIRVHMPTLAERFFYRPFDANALWMARGWLAGTGMVKQARPHRALPDARAAVQVVREFFGRAA